LCVTLVIYQEKSSLFDTQIAGHKITDCIIKWCTVNKI